MDLKLKDAKMRVIDDRGRMFEFPEFKIESLEFKYEPKETDFSKECIRGMVAPFSGTLSDVRISQYSIRTLSGTETNNELKRHHRPMRKRKKRRTELFIVRPNDDNGGCIAEAEVRMKKKGAKHGRTRKKGTDKRSFAQKQT